MKILSFKVKLKYRKYVRMNSNWFFLWLAAGLDPIQKLFLDAIREYSSQSQ